MRMKFKKSNKLIVFACLTCVALFCVVMQNKGYCLNTMSRLTSEEVMAIHKKNIAEWNKEDGNRKIYTEQYQHCSVYRREFYRPNPKTGFLIQCHYSSKGSLEDNNYYTNIFELDCCGAIKASFVHQISSEEFSKEINRHNVKDYR